MTDLIWADAVEQSAAIRYGGASAAELLQCYLDRIERLDPALRAYVAVDHERAIEQARAADAAVAASAPEALPPFHGVAISVKDVIDVAGLPTTHSCTLLADHVAGGDDPLVERLRDAGFIVLGKTNVPEFCTTMTASRMHGICRNPWDRERTAGGSSGGAAAAVAAGLCAIAHGTDGAGSVRVPAAFCGLVGVKPTRGLVTFGTERRNAYFGTSVDGVLSRSVRDAAGTLDVFANRAPTDSRRLRPTGPVRVALTTTPPFGSVEPECAAAATEMARVLEEIGHSVEARTPPWDTMLAVAAGPMSVPGAAGLVGRDQIDAVEPRNRPLLERLHELTVVEHAAWVDQCRDAAREFLRFWDDVDVLVSPTVGMVAPSVDWAPWDQPPDVHMATFASFPSFAQPFNLSGQPAVSVPLASSATGLPIGIQLAGRPFAEPLLLALAGQLEDARPWSTRRPAGV